MHRKAWIVILLLLCLRAARESAVGEESGTVTGAVLGEDRRPLAGATVYAVSKQDMSRQVRAVCDSYGRYTLTGLPPGAAYVDAYDQTKGYPYSFFSFFKTPGSGTPVEVVIKEGEETSGVIIRLGPRAAYLDLEISAEDGTRSAGTLSFDRTDIPGPYRRAVAPTESLMVPPVPFRLTFEATGYLPWHYGGRQWQGRQGMIALKSNQRMHLLIQPHPR